MSSPPPFRTSGTLPLWIEPRDASDASRDVAALCGWLREHPDWVQSHLTKHGALRFRGFAVEGAAEFERIARAVDDDLKNDYLGTSPRDLACADASDYVFNASELPDFYPIPQHCEMSFCATPPRRVFFCCLEAPAEGSGETPMCDFRAVWRDLDPAVRERFLAGGIRIVRNYSAASDPGSERADDPTMLKGWDEMFGTGDREEVEKQCVAEGFGPSWQPDGSLRLDHTQAVTREHPVTGETVWHNHLTTFHVGMALAEYTRIERLRPSERHAGLREIARQLDARLRAQPSDERSMHCTHADGSEIPDADIEAVRDTVWRHTVIEPWHRGDVVAIDNHAVSHGRMPYEGPRKVVVAWA